MTDPGEVPAEQQFELQLAWPDDVGAEAQPVNQVVFAFDQNFHDMVYMNLGHVPPPLWVSLEVAQERAAELGNRLQVHPRGSFVMSRGRAEELWRALGMHLGLLPRA